MLNRDTLYASIEAARSPDGTGGTGMPAMGLLVVRAQRLREFERLFGYVASERLQLAMADRLAHALRRVDSVVPIGECAFAVVLPQLHDRQHAALAASKVARLMREPFEVMGRPMRASITVGGATWPDDATAADVLCERADAACADAVHQRERHALSSRSGDDAVAHDVLHDALLRNQLQVYLQPIHGVADGRLRGFESLARWQSDDGWIPPSTFIAVAEQTGLIDELTRWSINATLRHCAEVLRAQPELTCSINLSPRAVLEPGIVDQIGSSLRIWGVPARALIVEITETAFVEDPEQTASVLGELHATGVGIAIDDYGTGYSSLSYLRHFPVTELKIDRSFVADMAGNPRCEQLVAAMIELAHRLGATAVAEGVEQRAELDALRRLGCDRYQGYYIARPGPADAVLAAIKPVAMA